MQDNVRTGNGRVEITFADSTKVKLTEQSKLVIDDFVYDGNKPKSGRMALKFASGTARFVTGNMGKQSIKLKTPTATIAVRGTDFTTTVDETGKSLFILLPEEDGTVGQIIVSNNAGTVILTKAFQSTIVATADSPPSKPVILKLDLNMIDNMMIVTPPEEDPEFIEDVDQRANILDLTELDVDFLKDDSLETNDIEMSTIDVDILGANFFEDEITDKSMDEQTKDDVRLVGTSFGKDPSTQVNAFIEQALIQFFRSVNNTAVISADKTSNINISITDNGKTNSFQLNDGGSTTIIITQNN